MVEKPAKHHILCFGEIMLRLSPPHGERLLQSSHFETYFGGAEANVAVALQNMGMSSEFVTALPDNPIGDACLQFLRAHNVWCHNIKRSINTRLGTYYVEQGEPPRPTQVVYDRAYSAFANLNTSDFSWPQLLKSAGGLHISGINFVVGNAPSETCMLAVETASAADLQVSFDVNRRPSLIKNFGTLNATYERLRSCITHLFASPAEIAHLLGDTQHTDVTHLTETEYKKIFTDRARTAFKAMPRLEFIGTTCRLRENQTENILSALASPDEIVFSVTRKMGRTIDRIGSGDAFAAACLYGIAHKMSLCDIKEFALAASLLKRTLKGDVLKASVNEIKSLAFDSPQSRNINR